MKISHRLIYAYLTIAVVMSVAGYLSISIYTDIKDKVIQLKKDSIAEFGSSDELLSAIESCQKSVQELTENRPTIIYSLSDMKNETETTNQIEIKLKRDLDKIEGILVPIIGFKSDILTGDKSEKDIKEWLDLRKKHFYYHWKYLSYFMNLADELPEQAQNFFEKTLEPHYRKNIFPIINKYRKGEQEAKEKQVRKIIEEYIPSADKIIISSTLITLLTVFLLGFWISHSVSKPLSRLTAAALDIGKGQLETHIDIRSKDEVGILAAAFNRMTNDLSKTTVSKSYVDNIIRSMIDMMIVVDSQAVITKVNRSALTLLGYRRKELVGMSIKDIIHEEKTGEGSVIGELIYRGSMVNVEQTYITKEGLIIPVLFSGAVIHGENGKIQGVVCMARDIVDRKNAEMALKRSYDEMERRVEERTTELVEANYQLKNEITERVRTEDALRESENRLRLLSSHILAAREKEYKRLSLELHDDLGQSLSLLKVQLSGIQRRFGDKKNSPLEAFSETREYLDFIIENVRRLSRDLSPSILEDLGLSAAIEWMANDFSRHYNIETDFNIENVDEYFSSDNHVIIYRIFQEILSNIGKHSRAALVKINAGRDGKRIRFAVEDNGNGFDMDEILTKRSTEKGMGIAAMQERALMLGSNLEIKTAKGYGTRVSFTVPVYYRS